jgi:hypothetical protein
VLRERLRVERLLLPERAHTRIERTPVGAQAATPVPLAVSARRRPDPPPAKAVPRAAMRPAEVRAMPPPAAGEDRRAHDPARAPTAVEDSRVSGPAPAPMAGAPAAPPDVEEIAERVVRVIERRARAQRERLGMV